MKNFLSILIICLASIKYAEAQNTFPSTGAVGIGTTTPDAASLLEVKSTTKGVLISRMTQTQRNAIASPATGLLIYQTDHTAGFYYYNGSAWTAISSKGANTSLSNLKSPTAVNMDLLPVSNNTLNFGSKTLNWKDIYIKGKLFLDSVPILYINGNNLLLGQNAGVNNSASTNNNIAIGHNCMYANTTGVQNIGIGEYALLSNTTGFDNMAIGGAALYSNTIGSANTALGVSTLFNNTTGENNTALGSESLVNNTVGTNNTVTGEGAMYFNTTGSSNTADGNSVLINNNTGSDNTGIGYNSLYQNATGGDNTCVGMYSANANTTGSNNTALGEASLYSNTTGTLNTGIGVSAYYGLSNLTNTTCLGYFSGGIANNSNRIEVGNTSITFIGGQVGWSTFSDARIKDNVREDVPGLAFINKLRPVSYNYNVHKENEMVYKGKKEEGDWAEKYDIEKTRFTGFIAQEVEKAANDVKYDFSGVVKPTNADDLYSLRYSDFVVPLVKAVQELSKQNDDLKSEVTDLKSQVEMLQQKNSDSKQLQNTVKTQATLQQNIPNPFDHSTTIAFSIPQRCSSASIIITESPTGQTVKTIPVTCSDTQVKFDASEFSSGNYSYSLIVDGKIVDTKSMIISK